MDTSRRSAVSEAHQTGVANGGRACTPSCSTEVSWIDIPPPGVGVSVYRATTEVAGMQPEPTITKPVDPPVRYVTGGRPDGNVRPLAKTEGG